MKRFTLAGLLLLALAGGALAQAIDDDERPGPVVPTALDAELFYQLILGELTARGDEPAAGYSLILDAARKTNDPALYQRAVDVAFQARSGDGALQAARAWKHAIPDSRDANRYVLQILVALNRVAESAEPLKVEIGLVDAKDRSAVISQVPRVYARVTDKKLAAATVEQALGAYLNEPATGAAAWTAVGRARLAAGDATGAVEAARRAQAINANAEGPALLALDLIDPKLPQAEQVVKRYLEGKPLPELRMGYARALLDAQRYPEASKQLQVITTEKPDYPEAWLVLGTLALQDNHDADAEKSIKRYVELAQAQRSGEERSRGLAQAYLSLSRIAEKRKDFALAGAWLDKIENPQDLVAAQHRRASILARQGRMDEARKLLRSLPERSPEDARAKMMAEVQLLRDAKQYKAAYDVLAQASAKPPFDPDLAYDQAMLAEKIGNMPEMERLLRQVIAAKPDYHHAYNALGYSLAERNLRLPEARELIQKALSYAPDDPFITDSLAWVEFRMGNKAEALRLLDAAYKARPDPDIAAHLGEVLWSSGQRERAIQIWKEGLLQGSDNETLQETLKRLRVKP
ncbi:tetratricopeptide repeat protein [Caenimonas koreensis]|uniref:Tetratricopeptide repeat protein n=1 Tax=Caenimonas koreensis DSM 17982 TaxID=1121255 RepID=A0A844AV47_9BURK|nr:tetratricopeptide repeat protein [Caenimonas koreensis]MRD48390.1 tetratricopeptide repeat protein [Caenimonas koreensis DSM 17982]